MATLPPAWFEWALNQTPEKYRAKSDGKAVSYLRWRPQPPRSMAGRKPQGLILVHGALAHAHWWDHVAPHLSQGCSGLHFDVVALSNTGHGDSDWREEYTADVYAREIVAVCRDAGFFDANREALPVIVGHSLGSFFSTRAVQLHPELFSGLIIADGGVPHPIVWSGMQPNERPPWSRPKGVKHRVYPATTPPEERLRLSPPQPILHPYVVDHIARTSVVEVPEAGAGSWMWAVDPDHSSKIESFVRWAHEIGSPEVVRGLPVKVAVLAGAESAIVGGMTLDYMRRELGQQIPVIALPGCGHHFFLDEPMAFVGVVAAMLAEWARADPARRTSHTNLVGPKEQVETEMREELGEIYGARFVAQRKPAAVKAGAAAAAGGASPLSSPPGSPGSPWGPELPPHASRLTSSTTWNAAGVDHVAIGVTDLAVAVDWYKAVLGCVDFMQHERTFVGDDLAFLRQGGVYLALLAVGPGQGGTLRGSRAQKGHFAMRVDGPTFWSLHKTLPGLLAQHRVHDEQPVDVMCDDFAVQVSMFFFDPDGNEVEITTWDCRRDDTCSRFGSIDDRSIRGNGNTAAASKSKL